MKPNWSGFNRADRQGRPFRRRAVERQTTRRERRRITSVIGSARRRISTIEVKVITGSPS